MLGLDPDSIDNHLADMQVADDKLNDKLNAAVASGSEDGFYVTLMQKQDREIWDKIILYGLSLPATHFQVFMETITVDFMKGMESWKPNIYDTLYFAQTLQSYWPKFFGSDNGVKNRAQYVGTAHRFLPISQYSGDGRVLHAVLPPYALLVDRISDEKLEFYRWAVKRACEYNFHLVPQMAQGLVAVLNNMPLTRAKPFVMEVFEIIGQAENELGGGLRAAQDYIGLRTNSARKRFFKLCVEG